MKKAKKETGDGLRQEYDLKKLGVRKLGRGRKSFGETIRLAPDVAQEFPNADSVNEALRLLIRLAKKKASPTR